MAGITTQRETALIWDRASGEPIYPAIVWQSRQTAAICDALKQRGLEEEVRARTGLVIDAYFSATKARFILDAVEGAQARAERGELAFGTVDTWLLWRLTHGEVHATDVTNASRTMLWNIHERAWDETLLTALDLPRSLLPEVRASSGSFGENRRGPARRGSAPRRCRGRPAGRPLRAEPASRPGKRRTRTARGASCSNTRARSRVPQTTAC